MGSFPTRVGEPQIQCKGWLMDTCGVTWANHFKKCLRRNISYCNPCHLSQGGYPSAFAAYKVIIHQKRESSFLPSWKSTAFMSYLSSHHRDIHVLYIHKCSIICGKNELFWACRCIYYTHYTHTHTYIIKTAMNSKFLYLS